MKVPQNLCYIILFKASVTRAYSPIVLHGNMPEQLSSTIGIHGFDKDLLPVLPALWYCTQLPRNGLDTLNLSWEKLKFSQKFEIPQRILLFPSSVDGKLPPKPPMPPDSACIIIFADELGTEAREIVKLFDRVIEILPFSLLSSESLKRHWGLIHQTFSPGVPQYCYANSLIPIGASADILLPGAFLARRLNNGISVETTDLPTSSDSAYAWAVHRQMELSVLADLEKKGYTQEMLENALKEYEEKGWPDFHLPVVLGVPGTPPRQKKLRQSQTSKLGAKPLDDPDAGGSLPKRAPSDSVVEESIIDFLVAHRALARTGIGITCKEIPKKAYEILLKLENCWDGAPRPFKVWKYLRLLGRELDCVLDEKAKRLLNHAEAATIFSDFPIGLGIIGNDTSPLLCRVPISYRPLTPLTRTVQIEASSPQNMFLGAGMSILVAECTPANSAVGFLSRRTWEFQSAQIEKIPNVEIAIREIGAISDLQSALAERDYDVLILSAHGVYNKQSNYAAVQCGKDVLLGERLENLPPFVILSACHVSPRALGAVTISDMLLRQGAVAVLATLIPVDVRKNATLVVRLLTNIFEAKAGRGPFNSLSEIWNHVQTSNAVNDIVSSNNNLKEWAFKRQNGISPMEKFMLINSRGKLTKAHIYKDTVKVLRELAVESKIAEQFDVWLAGDNYLPESMFYLLMGYSDSIYFKNPIPAKDS